MLKKLIFCFLLNWSLSVIALPDATTIVLKADDYRGYRDQPFKFVVVSICNENGKKVRENKVEVSFKRSDKVLVKFLEPKRERGRKIIIDEKNMWLSFPSTRNLIRISSAQRLIGEASNGDVANVDYKYYSHHLQGEEMLNGKAVLHLTLREADKRATYHRLELWVDKINFKPIKSEHYGISGKLIKTAYYESFIQMNNREFVNKVIIVSPISEKNYTVMLFDNYSLQELPDSIFAK